MTRLQALIELRDKVKAGEVVQAIDARDLWPEIAIWGEVCQASQGSLDSAKALHEAVLHERAWVEIHWSKRYDGESRVAINLGQEGWVAVYDTPARAWLLAILQALIAQEKDA